MSCEKMEHQSVVQCYFSLDGAKFATRALNKSIKIWETSTCKLIQTVLYDHHENYPYNASIFDPMGELLLTTVYNSVFVWDLNSGKFWQHVTFDSNLVDTLSNIWCMEFSPNGMIFVAVIDKTVCVCQRLSKKPFKKFTFKSIKYFSLKDNEFDFAIVNHISFNSNDSVVCMRKGDTMIWNVHTGNMICKVDEERLKDSNLFYVASINNKTYLATSCGEQVSIFYNQNSKYNFVVSFKSDLKWDDDMTEDGISLSGISLKVSKMVFSINDTALALLYCFNSTTIIKFVNLCGNILKTFTIIGALRVGVANNKVATVVGMYDNYTFRHEHTNFRRLCLVASVLLRARLSSLLVKDIVNFCLTLPEYAWKNSFAAESEFLNFAKSSIIEKINKILKR